MYAFAADVLRRSEETAQLLSDLKASRGDALDIAVHRDLTVAFLPQRLARHASTNPKSRVVTRIGTLEDVQALIESEAVQLGLLLGDGPLVGLQSTKVGAEPLVVVASPAHPLARRLRVGAEELSRAAFVTALRQSRYFRLIDRALRSAGVKGYSIGLELQEAAAVKQAVRHGSGLACLPRSTVLDEIASGALVALQFEASLGALEIRCAYAAAPGPAARRFISDLRAVQSESS